MPQEIPAPVLPESKIPPEVAISETKEDREAVSPKHYLIAFSKYNENECCEIDYLEKNAHKKALKDLIKIGKTSDVKQFTSMGIDKFPVYNDGEYKKLYRKLPPDIEIFEHKLQGSQRIFYYIIEPENTIHVVAITHRHFETKKERR